MIPPDCHSNTFSEIYGTSTRTANLDVSDIALDNHPVSTLGAPKRGWRAWKKAGGCNVRRDEACKTTDTTSFWLHLPGTHGAPTISEAYYDRPKWTAPNWHNPGDKTYRVYYLSSIGPYQCSYTCPYAQTGRDVIHSGHVFSIRPRCDRLLLAQNVRITSGGAFDTSRARLHWFAPRKHTAFSSSYSTKARPFMPPEESFRGWDGGDPYSSPSYGDWRFNPSIAPHRGHYNPDDTKTSYWESLLKLRDGYTPAEIIPSEWGAWNDPEDGVMLYQIIRKDEDSPWYTIYWHEDPLCVPENFDTTRLFAGLQGADAYSAYHAAILKESVSNNDIWNDINTDPIFHNWDAFDLCLYCQTYYYRVWRIDVDPVTGDETKVKIGRFYFNTRVKAKIRQIVPVPPAPIQI